MKRILSRTLLTLGVIAVLIVGNGCYWVFSDIQTRCADKIAEGTRDLPLRESQHPISPLGHLHRGSPLLSRRSLCQLHDAHYAQGHRVPTFRQMDYSQGKGTPRKSTMEQDGMEWRYRLCLPFAREGWCHTAQLVHIGRAGHRWQTMLHGNMRLHLEGTQQDNLQAHRQHLNRPL